MSWKKCHAIFKRSGKNRKALSNLLDLHRNTVYLHLHGIREVSQEVIERYAEGLSRLTNARIEWKDLLDERSEHTETIRPRFQESRGQEGDLETFSQRFRDELLKGDSVGELRDLYCSLTDGHWFWAHLQITGREGPVKGIEYTRAKLKKITVRRMPSTVYERMETPDPMVFGQEWRSDIESSLKKLNRLHRDPGGKKTPSVEELKNLKILIDNESYWPAMAPVWGFLIGDVLIYGKWKIDDWGQIVPRKTAWLVERGGVAHDEFEHYSNLLMHGNPRVETDVEEDAPMVVVPERIRQGKLVARKSSIPKR